MKGYIVGLLCIGCFCGIVQVFLPQGKRGGISKQARLVCSLCVLCAISAPLGGFIDILNDGLGASIPGIGDTGEAELIYRETFLESVKEHNAASVAEGLECGICGEYGIDREDISVRVDLAVDNNNCTIEGVTVFLSGKAAFKDPHSIKEYVMEISKSECEIIYD